MRLVARREHTRLELTKKLIVRGFERGDVDTLLNDFEEKGWLDERRYIDIFLRAKRCRYGSLKLIRELEVRGISRDLIEEVRPGIQSGELDAAQGVWQKRFGVQPKNSTELAKQIRFMQSRGFEQEVIKSVVNG
jgi:regulatory protein